MNSIKVVSSKIKISFKWFRMPRLSLFEITQAGTTITGVPISNYILELSVMTLRVLVFSGPLWAHRDRYLKLQGGS